MIENHWLNQTNENSKAEWLPAPYEHGQIIDEKIRLRTPAPSRGFKVITKNNMSLIVAGDYEKLDRKNWEPEEMPMRSIIINSETGEVLSSGWPKFWNLRETNQDGQPGFSPEGQLMFQNIMNGEKVYFSEKVDGMLLIRSVINGTINLRTRGTFDGGPMRKDILKLINEKYPVLLNPEFEPDRSLLFEFTSPDWRIVIKYEKPDITLLGAVNHKDLSLISIEETFALAKENNMRAAELFTMPENPDELLAKIETMRDCEGVVARFGQNLVKIKASEYLAMHRLRYSMSAKNIRAQIEENKISSLEEFKTYIKNQGADWELIADTQPIVNKYFEASKLAEQEYAKLDALIQTPLKTYENNRKGFATEWVAQLDNHLKSAAFKYFDGDKQTAHDLIRKQILKDNYDKLQAEDEKRQHQLEH